MIRIGFHTDAFNSSYWSFEQCLQWAQKNDVHPKPPHRSESAR